MRRGQCTQHTAQVVCFYQGSKFPVVSSWQLRTIQTDWCPQHSASRRVLNAGPHPEVAECAFQQACPQWTGRFPTVASHSSPPLTSILLWARCPHTSDMQGCAACSHATGVQSMACTDRGNGARVSHRVLLHRWQAVHATRDAYDWDVCKQAAFNDVLAAPWQSVKTRDMCATCI